MVYGRTVLAQRTFGTHVSRGGGRSPGSRTVSTRFQFLAQRLIVNRLKRVGPRETGTICFHVEYLAYPTEGAGNIRGADELVVRCYGRKPLDNTLADDRMSRCHLATWTRIFIRNVVWVRFGSPRNFPRSRQPHWFARKSTPIEYTGFTAVDSIQRWDAPDHDAAIMALNSRMA